MAFTMSHGDAEARPMSLAALLSAILAFGSCAGGIEGN